MQWSGGERKGLEDLRLSLSRVLDLPYSFGKVICVYQLSACKHQCGLIDFFNIKWQLYVAFNHISATEEKKWVLKQGSL